MQEQQVSGDIEALQLSGAPRHLALDKWRSRLADWRIAVPAIVPLVLDFGIGSFDRFGLIECWICNEPEAGYCGKYLFLFEGQSCPEHSHQVKHETFFVVRGRFAVTLDGQVLPLEEGDRLTIPPGRVHGFAAVGADAMLLELSMPCDPRDNCFVDPRAAAWLEKALSGGEAGGGD